MEVAYAAPVCLECYGPYDELVEYSVPGGYTVVVVGLAG